MRSGKLWSTVVDYFLMLGAIIGVGFASGKEICVFFFDFGSTSFLGLISFTLLYIFLFLVVNHIKFKLETDSYDEFSRKIFGRLNAFCNIIMLTNFIITSAGMLAGANYLFETFFSVRYLIPSLTLSVVAFLILLGGIDKIKTLANVIIPIMLVVIILNSIQNINPNNVHFEVVKGSGLMAIYYGLLFGVNNFVVALPTLFETKLKTKGYLTVILTISVVILLNLLVLGSNDFDTELPLFEISDNVNMSFYYIYFATIILAIFSTLVICSFNAKKIIFKDKHQLFGSLFVVLIELIISNLGYAFIVQYLYVFSGIIAGIFVLILLFSIISQLLILREKVKLKQTNLSRLGKYIYIKKL